MLNLHIDLTNIEAIYLYTEYMEFLLKKYNYCNNYSIFNSKLYYKITLEKFINNLGKIFKLSDSNYIYAICLLDKVIKSNIIKIHTYNVHLLSLVLLLLSSKMLEDTPYYNKDWGKYGGMSIYEINYSESYILKALDYNLHISLEDYETKLDFLRQKRYIK